MLDSEPLNYTPSLITLECYFDKRYKFPLTITEYMFALIITKIISPSQKATCPIRPSERREGLATLQLKMALMKAKELGILDVLITCDKDNIGSAKTA